MYQRSDRLQSIFLKELPVFIRNLNDTLLDSYFISIIKLTISKDLSKVDVYISTLDGRESFVPVQILNKKSYLIQRNMGKVLKLKKIPRFYFYQEQFTKYIKHIEHLIDNVNK